jgi:hypothetical protein
MKTSTTDKDFELFKRECKYWISKFGLIGWDVRYIHKDDADGDAAAYFVPPNDITTRNCYLGLAVNDFKQKLTANYIKSCAFHEVCELLLHRMQYLAKARYCQDEEIDEERHNLIRIFENAIFNQD